jgi:hypothetical protein
VLATCDSVNNELCEVADSCNILLVHFSQPNKFKEHLELHRTMMECQGEVEDFLNGLCQNTKLLTLLHHLGSNEVLSSVLESDSADVALHRSLLKFLSQHQS